ncbi:MAG: PDC sensor domain-containing protein [Pseudooceanicola sp.]
MKRTLLAAAMILGPAQAAQANQFEPAMRDYVEAEVLQWVTDPVLISALRGQNRRHAGLTQTQIDDLDRQWRAEVGKPEQPTIAGVTGTEAADFLRQRQDASAGLIAEIFVMDEHGLNVASSTTTSDYWQGDEAKFTESFGVGAGAMHVSEVEFDESTQSYLGQVSVPISDPDDGRVIGAITIGLNAEMLF